MHRLVLQLVLSPSIHHLVSAWTTNESLTSLDILYSIHNQGYDKFSREEVIVLLNDALQHNIHCRHLKLSTSTISISPVMHDLAYQLRRGPTGSQLKLKRSHSLPCLNLTSQSDLDRLFYKLKGENEMMKRVLFDSTPQL